MADQEVVKKATKKAAAAKKATAPKKAAAAAKPAEAKSVAPKKTVAKKAPVAAAPAVNPELRTMMIAEAAYYRAEQRGFSNGCEMDDWLEAEREIDTKFGR